MRVEKKIYKQFFNPKKNPQHLCCGYLCLCRFFWESKNKGLSQTAPFMVRWPIVFLMFVIVGVANTLINLAILYVLTEFFRVYYMLSAIIAFLFAVTNSFLLNKTWTFEEKIGYKTKFKYAQFIFVSITALIVNLILLYVLVEYFNVWYMVAQIIGIGSNLLVNFFGNKLWTFKE